MPKNSSDTVRLEPLVWKITSVAVLGSFLAQLDATIVNVSLSSLAVDLHSSLTAIQWVTSGYLLALALMLPLYLWCFSVFTLSSALCGLAWSANSLIAFRILQGMSGGLMAPMTQMMMARAAGKHMARLSGYAAVPFCHTPPGAGSSWSTCRSVYWQSSWRFSFCPMIAKRPGQENSIFLASPCSLLDSCSSCMGRIISANASVLQLSSFPSFCLRCSSEWQFAMEIEHSSTCSYSKEEPS